MQDANLVGSFLGLYDFHARYYDPVLGRWFNVDPALQLANPYVYCGNNPVCYVDPDGEFWWVIPLVIGLYTGGVSANDGEWNPGKWDWSSGKTWGGMLIGGAASVAGATAGIYAGLAVGMNVSASGFITISSSFLAGAAGGLAGGFTAGFISGAGMSWLNGENFGTGLKKGAFGGLGAGVAGAFVGGIIGGIDAAIDGRRFWDGAKVQKTTLAQQDIPIVGQRGNNNCGVAAAEAVDYSFGGNMTQEQLRNLVAPGSDPNTTPLATGKIWSRYADYSGHTIGYEKYSSPSTTLSNVLSRMQNGSRVAINLNLGENVGHTVLMQSITEKTITKINGAIIQKFFYNVMNPANGGRITQIPGSSISNSYSIFYISY